MAFNEIVVKHKTRIKQKAKTGDSMSWGVVRNNSILFV